MKKVTLIFHMSQMKWIQMNSGGDQTDLLTMEGKESLNMAK